MSDVGIGHGQVFTTRPELRGTFGMVSSTHWLATAAGMRMLELGGNAFDAAVAAGFALQVVQPHLNGPGGDMPALIWDTRVGEPEVLCGQGVAPAGATPERFAELGLDSIPGTGLLAPCIPGAFDAWLLMLRDRGSLSLRQVMEPAIDCAAGGFVVTPEMAKTIASVEGFLADEWPTSAEIWLPQGAAPVAGTMFRNEVLAETYQRLLKEAEAAGGDREAQIQAARDAFARGFVADAIVSFLDGAEVMDASGSRHRGLLSGDDMATWSATWEPTLTRDFRGVTVCKAGPWSQGPVLLQQLALLDEVDLESMDPSGAEYVHTLLEASKLAYADREVWYADPLFFDVPIDTLLSDGYAAARRALLTDGCSLEERPGAPGGREPIAIVTGAAAAGGPGIGEPTVSVVGQPVADGRSGVHVGDTCHLDVVDRYGNMVSATPSGGWLQSSPTIPGLGFALGTRMQMFDLADGHPNQVRPGKRPRTTLSPSLALRNGEPWMAFGTPGGDQQDQWTLQFLLNVVLREDDLQLAIDRPVFHSAHFRSSFYPRASAPGRVYMEDRYPAATIDELRRRGHEVQLTGPWSLTRMCAVARSSDGVLRAGANPRGMEAYAAGR